MIKKANISPIIGLTMTFLLAFGFNHVNAEKNNFFDGPNSINISITGNDHFAFKRLGIKAEVRYNLGERHSLGGGLVVNFIDPWDLEGFPEIGENPLYDYTPLFSWDPDFLERPPRFHPTSSIDESTKGVRFEPGITLSYEFWPIKRDRAQLLPFLIYQGCYQLFYGERRRTFWTTGPPGPPTYFNGYFHVFSNLLGLGIDYQPFDRLAFRLSSSTGIGVSRFYDNEGDKQKEEYLNRTFPYSQFDLGVRYQFSE